MYSDFLPWGRLIDSYIPDSELCTLNSSSESE